MKKVLLIDDNMLVRAAVEYYLAGRGYKVTSIFTTSDVVNEVRKRRPDVILTALYGEGYGAGRLPCLLRRQTRLIKNRALVLFSEEESQLLTEIYEAGIVNGYFRKEFSLDGLDDVIESSLCEIRNDC